MSPKNDCYVCGQKRLVKHEYKYKDNRFEEWLHPNKSGIHVVSICTIGGMSFPTQDEEAFSRGLEDFHQELVRRKKYWKESCLQQYPIWILVPI